MTFIPTTLNIIGLIANIIGTIILAFSISGYLRSMRLAIDAHELYIISVNNQQGKPVIQVTGTGVHMNRDRTRSSIFTTIGILLVLIGFAAQLISYLL